MADKDRENLEAALRDVPEPDERSPDSEDNARLMDPVEVPEEPPRAEAAGAPATPPAAAPAPPARGWAPPKKGWRLTIAIAVLAVAGALLALYAWDLPPFAATLQTTDNAYVRGQTTIISPQVSGYVTEVLVQDYQA